MELIVGVKVAFEFTSFTGALISISLTPNEEYSFIVMFYCAIEIRRAGSENANIVGMALNSKQRIRNNCLYTGSSYLGCLSLGIIRLI